MQKKHWLLALMATALTGTMGCADTPDLDVSCDELTFVSSCIDANTMVMCMNGMQTAQLCAAGCDMVTGQCQQQAGVEACMPGVVYPICENGLVVNCINNAIARVPCNQGFLCSEGTCEPGCQSHTDCSAPTPICDFNAGTCIAECTANADCKDAGKPVCESGKCVEAKPECTTNADCKDASKPVCESGTCVAGSVPECTTNADCKDASKPVCESGTCVAGSVPECTTNADCKDASKPVCKSGTCVEKQGCTSNADCSRFAPFCNIETGECTTRLVTGCQTHADCTDPAKPVCEEGTCVAGTVPECTTNDECTDPAKPVCEEGTCVAPAPECTTNDECIDPAKPVCSNGTCVPAAAPECITNDECTDPAKPVCSHGTCVAGSAPSTGNYKVEKCTPLAVTNGQACTVAGSGAKYVLRGDVLGTDTVWEGGSVVIDGTTITYVGCDPDLTGATVITCPNSVITPGIINAHDHITYSNQAPDSWGAERFDHRHDWRKNQHGHTNHNAKTSPNNESAEMRQLMAGVTSVFGSGILDGLIRNVDKEKIHDHSYPSYQTFPLGDGSGITAESGCSAYKYNTGNPSYNFGPHIGEGINAAALNELRCLSGEGSGAKDIFNNKLAIIHGVAATPAIIQKMANAGSSLIWSPRSNISLYGDTANVVTYDNMGVNIALGTDWTPSGSANMLREYACVDFLNTTYYGGHFSDYEIWKMGTINAAKALGLDPVIGALASGKVADIAMYAKSGRKAHRAVISAENKDLLLAMIDGEIVVGDSAVANAIKGSNCATDTVCGTTKKICPNGTSLGYATIKNNARYPLFFCGEPSNEPTCVPQRTRTQDTDEQNTTRYDGNISDNFSDPNDIDGDGISNAQDNCPGIFNPIRPQDGTKANRAQGDADKDGIGDACDLYPLCSASDASCPSHDGGTITPPVDPEDPEDPVDPEVPPTLVGFSPDNLRLKPGESQTVTLNLDKAAAEGMTIAIATTATDLTVPDSVQIAAGQSSATVNVAIAANAAENQTYTVEARLGTDAPKVLTVTIAPLHVSFDNAYTVDFVEATIDQSDYAAEYSVAVTSDIQMTAVGNFNDSSNGEVYLDAAVLTGNSSKSTQIQVTGIAGLGSLTIDWRAYNPSAASNKLHIYTNDNTTPAQTLTFGKTDIDVTTYTFDDESVTSFIVAPEKGTSTNKTNRIAINSISWTTSN